MRNCNIILKGIETICCQCEVKRNKNHMLLSLLSQSVKLRSLLLNKPHIAYILI